VSRVMSAALLGVDGVPIEVEVRLSSQLPRVDVVGLPEAAVRESAARVRAAIAASGHSFPDRRVTVNLAPAGIRKGGAGLDLAIAVGILAASGGIPGQAVAGVGFLGELALDGRLRPVRGALAQVMALGSAGCGQVVVPEGNGAEASLARDVRVHTAPSLAAVLASLVREQPLPRASPPAPAAVPPGGPDLRDIRGQEQAKRALEIAAAGGHGLLLRGPPGAGKTLLARALPGLLPDMEMSEALEVTQVHSARGALDDRFPLALTRPFRAPHHTASRAGLLGGGTPSRPGEVSLAHRGVLFLDEFPEFERRALESLRQVMEDRRVVVARASGTTSFPASFQLVAASNPCPCGYYGSPVRDCRCDEGSVSRYEARISGPLLDRIDLHVRVPAVGFAELDGLPDGACTDDVRSRVARARSLQAARGFATNAEIPLGPLEALVRATPAARAVLGRAAERLGLSARGVHRALRVARTIADLADEERVDRGAMAEAVGFRESQGGGRA